ncbi:LysR family transcriptional regulator [Agrobacterium rubi]|uniref:HTH-type transcriptional regulator TtuA n=1 Tax=Agrobacterium rubi TaxID=28099 RepID=A0AAE7UPG0_9HYPH|nr:LysR family transcriptional regulator [Agrobacterium rubi]NTE88022.1 LysR family transcriptional regulator [Agrobacterium rubi]NTF03789.1 LysR family transcriptional regulator [Agrobacterium rubi]NTF38116.1 LysR family transcriptional regulator [Agrobacterium rubi]OCJ43627.1 LysR family transcriptional regulator [Agrobacterium rubi]QTG01973.1 LysR family transcriptional regulator [Agrobacterium rubi]
MTFEQLAIFVAVAEREHLTKAAAAIHLTPSAVSASIRNLEQHHGVELFHRIGRRIELTATGRIFLDEARTLLARSRSVELMLSELGGMQRGSLSVFASQTIASYWLPPRLMAFHNNFPGIELQLTIGNTRTVADAVITGEADIGFVEGELDEPALAASIVAHDELVVVVGPTHPWAGRQALTADDIKDGQWVMREVGSGTRSAFEETLSDMGIKADALNIVLVLPSNESILCALLAGNGVATVSRLAAQQYIESGKLCEVNFPAPAREFRLLKHKERHASKAALTLLDICHKDT